MPGGSSVYTLPESSRLNALTSVWVSYALVVVMQVCLAVTVQQFGERLVPAWDGGFLPWFAALVCIEALVSARNSRRLAVLTPEWVGYRIGEWTVLAIALKSVLYLSATPIKDWFALESLRSSFVANFISGEFLGALVIIFFLWTFSSQYAEDLLVMETEYFATADSIPKGIADERLRARHALVNRVFLHGAMMLVLVTLVRLDLAFVFGERPPVLSGAVYLLLYFVFALTLLSQTQFTVLHAGWSWQGLSLDRNLAIRWAFYSLVFLIGVAALALLLPTRFTVGFLALLGYVVNLVFYAGAVLFQILIYLLVSIVSLFRTSSTTTPESPPVPPVPPAPPATPGQPAPWLDLAISVISWLTLLAVIGVSIYQYYIHHSEAWRRMGKFPGAEWLQRVWRWLRSLFGGVNERISSVVKSGLSRMRRTRSSPKAARPWRFINLRRLSPKERVYFFYLALLRRSREAGHPRGEYQTPYEYERTLRESLPENSQELTDMTATFVEARYSQHEVSEETAGLVRRWWSKLRRALRREKLFG